MPFRYTGDSEVEIEFSIKQDVSSAANQASIDRHASGRIPANPSPCLITVAPSTLKFNPESGDPQILALQIRLKNSYLMQKMSTSKLGNPKPELYRHLLCGQIKHTTFTFSFYLETLITAESS